MTQTPSIERAIEFALTQHSGQTRKGSGLPYIVHPIEVTKRLSDLGVQDAEVLCAAALHDVLEDGSAGRDEIEREFGERVARIVGELTFDESVQSKAEYMASFAERSVEALVIKLIDRACNVDDYARGRPEYAPVYAGKARALFAAVGARSAEIVGAFGETAAGALWAEATRLLGLAR